MCRLISWRVLVLAIVLHVVNGDITCSYSESSSTARCGGRGLSTVPQEIAATIMVTLNSSQLLGLDLSNNSLETITNNAFQDFPNVQVLLMNNCSISNIESNAFEGLNTLTSVDLSNNHLATIDSAIFKYNAALEYLVLANNNINTLDGFDIESLKFLNLLDISNNEIVYLPVSILSKLEEPANFILDITNNPWNCEDDRWAEELKIRNLSNIFCQPSDVISTTTVQYASDDEATQNNEIAKEMDDEYPPEPFTRGGVHNASNDTTPVQASAGSNLLWLWILLAFGGGALIGNVDRIPITQKLCKKRQSSGRYVERNGNRKEYSNRDTANMSEHQEETPLSQIT